MRLLIAAVILIAFPSTASAGESMKDKLVGCWWGSITIMSGSKMGWDRRWIIERTEDGRFRKQEFMVDPVRKVYAAISTKPEEGVWRLTHSLVTHAVDHGSTWSDSVTEENGSISWEGGSMSGPPVKWTSKEVKILKFAPQLDENYKLITVESFKNRHKG